MIGIIYKFSIRAKIKYDGNLPYYIGQHWERKSIEYFLSRQGYLGSGAIWQDIISGLKKKNPVNWFLFIKKEILYQSEKATQKTLDILEKYYIAKFHSLYNEHLGGCNILIGSSNGFGCVCAMANETIRKKVSKSLKIFFKTERGKELRKQISIMQKKHSPSEETRKKMSESTRGEKAFWYGKHLSEETREKLRQKALERYNSPYGEILRKKISNHPYKRGKDNPFYGIHRSGKDNPFYGHHHSEETKRILSEKHKKKKQS